MTKGRIERLSIVQAPSEDESIPRISLEPRGARPVAGSCGNLDRTGSWRTENDETENYVYAIALLN